MHAAEVAMILRKNIVQGEQVDGAEEKYRGLPYSAGLGRGLR